MQARHFLVFLFALVWCLGVLALPQDAGASARLHGAVPQGAPVGSCTQQIDPGGNCAAQKGGQFLDVNTTTTVRQSGQPCWKDPVTALCSTKPMTQEICGWTYGCGQTSPDNQLTDVTVASNLPATCVVRAAGTGAGQSGTNHPRLACSPTCPDPMHPITIEITGYHFNDVGFDGNTASLNQCAFYWVHNNHFTVGLNMCRTTPPRIQIQGQSFSLIEDNTFDQLNVCDQAANMWGSPNQPPQLTQQSSFTGTPDISTGSLCDTFPDTVGSPNCFQPNVLHVGTGTTGTMASAQYIAWAGKAFGWQASAQLLWFVGPQGSNIGWHGFAHTSANGAVLLIDSTDADSGSAAPKTGDSVLCSVCGRRGPSILRFDGASGGYLMNVPKIFTTSQKVWTTAGNRCTGSTCDNGYWSVAIGCNDIVNGGGTHCNSKSWQTVFPTLSGPTAMNTGPILGADFISSFGGGSSTGGNLHCTLPGSPTAPHTNTLRRNVVIQSSYIALSHSDCPITDYSNYIHMRMKFEGYLDFGNGNGVEHGNSILEQDISGSGLQTSADGRPANLISDFSQIGDFIWSDQWSAQGSVTAYLTLFAFYDGNKPGGFLTEYQNVDWSHSIVAFNKTYNNNSDYLTQPNQNALLIRTLSQTSTPAATATSATITSDGNGTGPGSTETLHINTVGTGTIAVGLYPQCAPAFGRACNFFGSGGRIVAQLPTQGADVSTWQVSPAVANGVTNNLVNFYLYPGLVDSFTMVNTLLDPTGSGTCAGFDQNIPVLAQNFSGTRNLLDNSSWLTSCNHPTSGLEDHRHFAWTPPALNDNVKDADHKKAG